MGRALSTSEPRAGGIVVSVWAALLGGFCHLIPFTAIRPDLERFEFESKHMGTTFRIVLYAADKDIAKKAADAAFARVAELDNCMSDYKQTSELMQLCKKFSTVVGEPVKVSDDLFSVLAAGADLSRK